MTIAHGIDRPAIRLAIEPGEIGLTVTGTGIALNGEVIASLPGDLHAGPYDRGLIDGVIAALGSPDAEVDMELTGTPKIGLKIPGIPGPFKVPEVLVNMLQQTWDARRHARMECPR